MPPSLGCCRSHANPSLGPSLLSSSSGLNRDPTQPGVLGCSAPHQAEVQNRPFCFHCGEGTFPRASQPPTASRCMVGGRRMSGIPELKEASRRLLPKWGN